ncbi:hypothetical protein I3843_03G196200 [Carya illinoinensis]|nr:hypothetical protein I3760_03G199100 [Carya illinoinensis]KAG7988608.1 hypothetical protein I3843_03G196200 [Carya illinoinensis]
MTVSRSQKIVPIKPTKSISPRSSLKIEPSTPSRTHESSASQSLTPPMSSNTPSSRPTNLNPVSLGLGSDSKTHSGIVRRRSLRLASKSGSGEGPRSDSIFPPHSRSRKRKNLSGDVDACSSGKPGEGESMRGIDGGLSSLLDKFKSELELDSISRDSRVLAEKAGVSNLAMGSCVDRVRGLNGNESGWKEDKGLMGSDEAGLGSKLAKGNKRKLGIDGDALDLEHAEEDGESKVCINLRSGKRVAKRGEGGVFSGPGCDKLVDNKGESERAPIAVENHIVEHERKLKREEKGKGKLVQDDLVSIGVNFSDDVVKNDGSKPVYERLLSAENEKGNKNLNGAGEGSVFIEKNAVKGRRFGREEKGKAVEIDGSLLLNGDEKVESGLESESRNSVEDVASGLVDLVNNAASLGQTKDWKAETRESESSRRGYMNRFYEVAKENASRFAIYSPQEEDENHVSSEAEEERDLEDWPGPFSTAMSIIKDRATKSQRVENSSLEKSKCPPFIWVPKYSQNRPKRLVPSLKEQCLAVLAENVEAIASLECVPDALKHTLSQLLCDSRRMNSHCFELLIRGSPTEVRVRDCSWLTEEQFTKSFHSCDTSNLTVLQLDHCGRCIPDYILLSTLACSSNSLPALTTLSLSGACRLSDVGLSAIVSSAPALRSLNLSQCSLLSSSSIDTLANTLGSVLRELYLTDCQSIDAMLILPALKKLEQLQVLSVAGIPDVCDHFIKEFIRARGHNMKELVLTDCVKLTDSSLKVIAESCPGLCAIDLVNLCKLTDSALGYLANGCQGIQTLKLCRNPFSDEAIAAYLETSGEFLKELSVNNVKKVSHNTAISLARRSRMLHTLDLSWCRNLTDEAIGFIVDSCLSLRVLKLFGCTQITNVFLEGHSNPDVQIVGLKMSSVLDHVKVPDHQCPLRYS